MITFWMTCAVFVAIALAFVLPPLLERPLKDEGKDEDKQSKQKANIDVYRDQLSELNAEMRNGIISPDQYQQDRDEIERRLLEDVSTADGPAAKESKQVVASRAPVYAIALGIPIIAVAMYLRVGNPSALSPQAATPVQAPFAGSQNGGQMTRERMEANVQSLAKRLEQNPADTQGWIMLGRSYTTLEKYSDASRAYAKATALKSDDADLWVDYAFAMAMANGQQLQGAPLELVNKALKLDPDNAKALELAGTAEFQAKNYKQAIEHWQKLLARVPPGSELAEALSRRIEEAKSLAGPGAK
ncbi:MAG: c-type cytochrome biogenesis protein CcmI [Acidobacteriota bacterium]|nr:c-type cytochrome biogenesis protein CcmI [Acidobacteriota bacterium]